MTTPQIPNRVSHRRMWLVIVAVIAALIIGSGSTVLALTLTRHSTSPVTADDSGKVACQMMAEDKRSGSTPDEARSQQEIQLLQDSANLDLVHAANMLGNETIAFDAVGPLYQGCAAVGVPLA